MNGGSGGTGGNAGTAAGGANGRCSDSSGGGTGSAQDGKIIRMNIMKLVYHSKMNPLDIRSTSDMVPLEQWIIIIFIVDRGTAAPPTATIISNATAIESSCNRSK
jgi:hypothetical protein